MMGLPYNRPVPGRYDPAAHAPQVWILSAFEICVLVVLLSSC